MRHLLVCASDPILRFERTRVRASALSNRASVQRARRGHSARVPPAPLTAAPIGQPSWGHGFALRRPPDRANPESQPSLDICGPTSTFTVRADIGESSGVWPQIRTEVRSQKRPIRFPCATTARHQSPSSRPRHARSVEKVRASGNKVHECLTKSPFRGSLYRVRFRTNPSKNWIESSYAITHLSSPWPETCSVTAYPR